MQESKEKIKSRMIKNASRLWGYQDTEDESSFDPIVGMLMSAMAAELAKISGEIHSTESRVVEKLVELLTPEPITGPVPAHALVRAVPSEPVFTIHPNYRFFTRKKYFIPGRNSYEEKSVFFTPASSYKLFNGSIKFLAAGAKLFEITEENYKETVAQAGLRKILPPTSIWMGLQIDDDIKSLAGLSFCFDLRNEVYKETFYSSLARGQWSVNGTPAIITKGFGGDPSTKGFGSETLFREELDVTTKICNHVNRFYMNNFMTLSGGELKTADLKRNSSLPQEFTDVFNLKELDKIDRNLFWVKVEFPLIIPAEVTDDLFCSINTFPVINRKLNEFTQSCADFLSIIPLITDEFFLDVHRVGGTSGSLYSAKAFTGSEGIDKGTFIIRHGGVARFDSRNAAEMLDYLLELLRDESAAFSILGTDMISSNLKELSQTIARLEQRLKDSHLVKEDIPYLMLKSLPGDDMLFVEFWSTNGTFSNKIKSGESLSSYEGSDLLPGKISFLTPTMGGKERMDTDDRVNAYRKALLSHGRVVTSEDIKALCFEHFGKMLKSVEVKKGVQTGLATDSGFIRTLDIYLTFSKLPSDKEAEDLEFLKKDLLVKLEEQSPSLLTYRIII
jgi:hypothetical protein